VKPAKLALAVLALIALVAVGRFAGGYFADFAAWVKGVGPAGPLVFILAYAAAVVAFVPGSILSNIFGNSSIDAKIKQKTVRHY